MIYTSLPSQPILDDVFVSKRWYPDPVSTTMHTYLPTTTLRSGDNETWSTIRDNDDSQRSHWANLLPNDVYKSYSRPVESVLRLVYISKKYSLWLKGEKLAKSIRVHRFSYDILGYDRRVVPFQKVLTTKVVLCSESSWEYTTHDRQRDLRQQDGAIYYRISHAWRSTKTEMIPTYTNILFLINEYCRNERGRERGWWCVRNIHHTKRFSFVQDGRLWLNTPHDETLSRGMHTRNKRDIFKINNFILSRPMYLKHACWRWMAVY